MDGKGNCKLTGGQRGEVVASSTDAVVNGIRRSHPDVLGVKYDVSVFIG